VVVDKTYDLVLWLVQKLEKFPKAYRFSLGQRLVDTGLDLLLLLVDAAYRKDKREPLRAAGAPHERPPVAPPAGPRPAAAPGIGPPKGMRSSYGLSEREGGGGIRGALHGSGTRVTVRRSRAERAGHGHARRLT
jgi:hypothetical protein